MAGQRKGSVSVHYQPARFKNVKRHFAECSPVSLKSPRKINKGILGRGALLELSLDKKKKSSTYAMWNPQKSLKFIGTKGNYNCNRRTVNVLRTTMCEIRVHLWNNVFTLGVTLSVINNRGGVYVLSSLPGWTDTNDTFPVSVMKISSVETKIGTKTCTWCFARNRNGIHSVRH